MSTVTRTQSTHTPSRRGVHLSWSMIRDYGVVILLVVLFVALSLGTTTFFSVSNFVNIVQGVVPTCLIAVAGTLVIIAGGFDLSAGAIFAVSAIVGGQVSNSTSPTFGILAGVAVGSLLGLVNGLLTTVGRINNFVATLGTSIVYGGLAIVLSGSGLLLISDPAFSAFGNSSILGLRSSVWILIIVVLLFMFLLNRTVFGRHVFGAGGNARAARLSGVPVGRTVATTYVLSGAIAAVAGVIVAGQSLSVGASSGLGIIFDALAAILIGGNSVLGGEGAIWRTVVGVFILALISNGFNLIGVDPLWQQIVNGIIILLAVGADAWSRRST